VAEIEEVEEDGQERVVLGRMEDTFAGFSWTGAEPEGVGDLHEAESYGAVWEGDELVTYELGSLTRQFENAGDNWLEDND